MRSRVSRIAPESETAEASPAPRELTLRGVLLGIVLALVLGAANAYLGLYAGLTVSASIPAAVVSMAVLRMLGGATILENNVVQTIASAGEAVAAGAIFTFPALVILSGRGPLPYLDVTALSVAGGLMGALLVVFLRKPYIVDERLPFPEGLACAEVLRAGGEAVDARPLLAGGIVAAALKAAQGIVGVLPAELGGSRWFRGAALCGELDVSAALLGVGYIVGVRIATLVFAGGVLAWLVAVPILTALHPELHALGPAAAASRIWGEQVRYLGVGAMLTGGLATLWRLRSRILTAIRESLSLMRSERPVSRAREETDLPAGIVLGGSAAALPIIFALCLLLSGNPYLSAAIAVMLALVGFFATAVAGYLTGLVGASNNPVSGVTVIVLLVLAIVLRLLGVAPGVGPRLAIMVGAVVCTAAAMAGDSMHDLATGFHVGATPRALEIAVAGGAIVSSLAMAPVLNMLLDAYGIAGTPTARAGALPAPQAFLMAKVAGGVFQGGLPWNMIAAGVALACGLALLDSYLERRQSSWRAPIMPVAIGLYLPLGLGVTIFLGSLLGLSRKSEERGPGLLFAAGMIAGEALMGVLSGGLVTAGMKLPLL
jgi:putative OPT family oligopeptide transporter